MGFNTNFVPSENNAMDKINLNFKNAKITRHIEHQKHPQTKRTKNI